MNPKRTTIYLIKSVIWIAMCLHKSDAYAQNNTYIKNFKIFDENRIETGWSLFTHKNEVYINSGAICNSASCAFYAKLDENGNVVWRRKHLWTDSANFNTFAIGDNNALYIGSHSFKQEKVYYLLKVDKDNGDSIRNCRFEFADLTPDFVALNGILLYNGDIVMYGEGVGSDNNARSAFLRSDYDCSILAKKLHPLQGDNMNGTVRTMDLQADSTGHLTHITQTSKNFIDYSVLRTIDSLGNIVREIEIPAGSNQSNQIPVMGIDTRGNYILEHRIRINIAPHIQLLCIDTTGKTIWDYTIIDYNAGPDKPDKYDYNKIRGTKDGGIIAAGIVESFAYQAVKHTEAYVLKLDKAGQKEWERRLNFYDNRDTLFDRCNFLDVVQMDDGGYAAYGYRRYSDTSGLEEPLLVRFDKNGCIAGYDCSVDTIIVRSPIVSVADEHGTNTDWIVYPNPFADQFIIANISEKTYQITCSDVMGKIISNHFTMSEIENININTSTWPKGMYFLNAKDINGNKLGSKKVLKM
jgi:hypothetical protein